MGGFGKDVQLPPRWVWFVVFGPVVLCLSCSVVGYFAVWPQFRDVIDDQQHKVSQEVANSLRFSLGTRLSGVSPDAPLIRISESDLDINNVIVSDGSSGIESGTSGTTIFGFVTSITPTGLSILSGDQAVYSGMPVVESGRIAMTRVEASNGFMELLLTDQGFAEAFETGINDALNANGLRPTRVTLSNGTMVIHTEPLT